MCTYYGLEDSISQRNALIEAWQYKFASVLALLVPARFFIHIVQEQCGKYLLLLKMVVFS